LIFPKNRITLSPESYPLIFIPMKTPNSQYFLAFGLFAVSALAVF
jgi:hypothetical protein